MLLVTSSRVVVPGEHINNKHAIATLSSAASAGIQAHGGQASGSMESIDVLMGVPVLDGLPDAHVPHSAQRADGDTAVGGWLAEVEPMTASTLYEHHARVRTAFLIRWNFRPLKTLPGSWHGKGFALSFFTDADKPDNLQPTFAFATVNVASSVADTNAISPSDLALVAGACACPVFGSHARPVGQMAAEPDSPDAELPWRAILQDKPCTSLQASLRSASDVPPPSTGCAVAMDVAPAVSTRIVASGIAFTRHIDGLSAAYVTLRRSNWTRVTLFAPVERPYVCVIVPKTPYLPSPAALEPATGVLAQLSNGPWVKAYKACGSVRYPPLFSLVTVHLSTGAMETPVYGIRIKCANEASIICIRASLSALGISADLADYRPPSFDTAVESLSLAWCLPPPGTVVCLNADTVPVELTNERESFVHMQDLEELSRSISVAENQTAPDAAAGVFLLLCLLPNEEGLLRADLLLGGSVSCANSVQPMYALHAAVMGVKHTVADTLVGNASSLEDFGNAATPAFAKSLLLRGLQVRMFAAHTSSSLLDRVLELSPHTFYDGVVCENPALHTLFMERMARTSSQNVVRLRNEEWYLDCVPDRIRLYLSDVDKGGYLRDIAALWRIYCPVSRGAVQQHSVHKVAHRILRPQKYNRYTTFQGTFMEDMSWKLSLDGSEAELCSMSEMGLMAMASLPAHPPQPPHTQLSALVTCVQYCARRLHLMATAAAIALNTSSELHIPLALTIRNSALENVFDAWVRTTREHNATSVDCLHVLSHVLETANLDEQLILTDDDSRAVHWLFTMSGSFTYGVLQTLARIQKAATNKRKRSTTSSKQGVVRKRVCAETPVEVVQEEGHVHIPINLGPLAHIASRVCSDNTGQVSGLEAQRKAAKILRRDRPADAPPPTEIYSIDRIRAYPSICADTNAGLHTIRVDMENNTQGAPVHRVVLPNGKPLDVWIAKPAVDGFRPVSMEALLCRRLFEATTSLGQLAKTSPRSKFIKGCARILKIISTSVFGGAGRSPFIYMATAATEQADSKHKPPRRLELSEMATVSGSLLKDIVTCTTAHDLWVLLAKVGVSGIGEDPIPPAAVAAGGSDSSPATVIKIPGGLRNLGLSRAWLRRLTVDGAEWEIVTTTGSSNDKLHKQLTRMVLSEGVRPGSSAPPIYRFERVQSLFSNGPKLSNTALIVGYADPETRVRDVKLIPAPSKCKEDPHFIRRLALVVSKGDLGTSDIVTLVRRAFFALAYGLVPIGELTYSVQGNTQLLVRCTPNSETVPAEEAILTDRQIDVAYYQTLLRQRIPVLQDTPALAGDTVTSVQPTLREYMNMQTGGKHAQEFDTQQFDCAKAYQTLRHEATADGAPVAVSVAAVVNACWTAQWMWFNTMMRVECSCGGDNGHGKDPFGSGGCAYHGVAPNAALGRLVQLQYLTYLPRRVVAAPRMTSPAAADYGGRTFLVAAARK